MPRRWIVPVFLTCALLAGLSGCGAEDPPTAIDYKDLLFHADRYLDQRIAVARDLGVFNVDATEHGPYVSLTDYICIASPYRGDDPEARSTVESYCYVERRLDVLFLKTSGTIRTGAKVRLEGTVQLAGGGDWTLVSARLMQGTETLASDGIATLPFPLR